MRAAMHVLVSSHTLPTIGSSHRQVSIRVSASGTWHWEPRSLSCAGITAWSRAWHSHPSGTCSVVARWMDRDADVAPLLRSNRRAPLLQRSSNGGLRRWAPQWRCSQEASADRPGEPTRGTLGRARMRSEVIDQDVPVQEDRLPIGQIGEDHASSERSDSDS